MLANVSKGSLVIVAAGLITWGILRWQYQPQAAPAAHVPSAVEPKDFLKSLHTEPIQPIPPVGGLDARLVALGKKLFHDPRLSHDNSISCATCHPIDGGGADKKIRSIGINGAVGGINTPTVLNSGLNFRQFWDGRANTLEEQVDGPTHHPKEMGSNWEEILSKLNQDSELQSKFKQLFPDGIQAAHIRSAIASFERSLVTPHSRFDRYLLGEHAALHAEEIRGYVLFKEYGCISCHQGVNVGGNMFQRFGVMGDYFADRGNPTTEDLGRFNITGEERDRHRFKVPGLRNVVLTPPYFHDGSAATLEDAVRVMTRYQLGTELPESDIRLIVGFLHTLTGQGLESAR